MTNRQAERSEQLVMYATSGQEVGREEDPWGQRPAVDYVFKVEDSTLKGTVAGVYVSSGDRIAASKDLTLSEELEAWDRASDRALRLLGPDV